MTTPFALEMAELSGIPVSPEELEMLAGDRYPSDGFLDLLKKREASLIEQVGASEPGALRLLAGVQFVKRRMQDWRFEFSGPPACTFGSSPDSLTVACGKPSTRTAAGLSWCADHGPVAVNG